MKKKITIEYEIDEKGKEFNSKLTEGSFEDLLSVLVFSSDKRFNDTALTATTHLFLRMSSRAGFLAQFFATVDKADKDLEKMMSNKVKS